MEGATSAATASPSGGAAAPPPLSISIGNLAWMAERGVAVSAGAKAEVERLEEGGCTVVVAAVDTQVRQGHLSV